MKNGEMEMFSQLGLEKKEADPFESASNVMLSDS